MEIGSLDFTLSAITQNTISPDIGVALLSKQLDSAEVMGDEMVKMMEMSVNPAIGGNIDISL